MAVRTAIVFIKISFLKKKSMKELLQNVKVCSIVFGTWVSVRLFLCVFKTFFEVCLGNGHGQIHSLHKL